MLKVLVYGANGHMGKIVRELVENTEGFDLAGCVDALGGDGCLTDLNAFKGTADVLIDFSHHSLTQAVTQYAAAKKMPVVLATTGQTPEEKQAIAEGGRETAVFFSANMSPAIAMLAGMAAQAARMFPDADIEIIERHHNRKVDVPSGTALIFADAVMNAVENSTLLIGRHENGRRKPREVAVHSLRIGNEVGTHEVIIATGTQTITLKHEAESRALFAEGALKAAQYIVKKPCGVYNMQDMLSSEE